MKARQQSTVEPIFGSLINNLGMSKMNTLGIRHKGYSILKHDIATRLGLKKGKLKILQYIKG